MSSRARKKFDENAADIGHLLDLYDAMEVLSEADGLPPPEGKEVLLKSAVVLMVSHWEAYVEDICSEALEHLVKHVKDSDKLPKDIKKQIAAELKNDKNELALWSLADQGWRTYLKDRLESLKEIRNRSFNTPKAQNTTDFLKKALGIDDIRRSWDVNNLTVEEISKRLDSLIEIRGQIAHRGRISQRIDKKWVKDQIRFFRRVVAMTGGRINRHIEKITGTGLW